MELTHSLWSLVATALLAFTPMAEAVVDNCTRVVVSETLPVLINSDSVLTHLQSLQDVADSCGGSRRTGTQGHAQTLEYIKDHLSSQGYYVEVQHFEGLMQTKSKVTLVVNDELYEADAIGWSPSSNLTGRPLIFVNATGCRTIEYPKEALGGVVLVAGGGCAPSIKSIAAGGAGADAIIVHEPTELSPSLGGLDDRHIPSARISERDARYIQDLEGPLWAEVVEISTEEYGDEENTLLVGTHTDSVSDSAGINDNASGIASLLEIATQLAKFKTNSRVKFAFWTAAEPCLLGSRHWVSTAYEEDLRRIRLYLDVNMLGSPNGALRIYDGNGTEFQNPGPRGSGHAEETLARGFDAQGAHYKRAEISNRSDYAPFFDAHIPIAGLFSGANGFKTADEVDMFGGQAGFPYDSNYHQPEDNMENINITALMANTKALAHAIGTYGHGFEDLLAPSEAGRYVVTMQYLIFVSQVWILYWVVSHAL
ncbi:Zn-dependent exopeptidase [Hypoxylon crocopeplum]|nr:Zn-dependent exopeptidase [Hypoxylon crocopeplum]